MHLQYHRTVGVTAVLALLAGGAMSCQGGSPQPTPTPTLPAPPVDPFYTHVPADLHRLPHGSVIRSRPATITANGISDVATARTVIFSSTDIHGRAIAASETVLTPHHAWSGTAKRPLLAVLPPYDSINAACDPSYTMQTGSPAAAGTLQTVRALVGTGVELVVPDFEGPQALFGVGDQEGRIVLDGIAAAERTGLGGISSTTRVAAYGYSGGAIASGWAAELAPAYAPRLQLVGVAEGGVPADIKQVLATVNGTENAWLAVMVLEAMARAYPHAGITAALNATGRAAFAGVSQACGGNSSLAGLSHASLDSLTTAPGLLDSPALQPVFAATRLGKVPPKAAIYNYQGTADEVVPFAADRALVDYYCRSGVTVDFQPIRGADHLTASITGAAGVAAWLKDRLDGKPAPDNCTG